MKKIKTDSVSYMRKKRASWAICPVTRIKQDITKDNKKRRQNERKIIMRNINDNT